MTTAGSCLLPGPFLPLLLSSEPVVLWTCVQVSGLSDGLSSDSATSAQVPGLPDGPEAFETSHRLTLLHELDMDC